MVYRPQGPKLKVQRAVKHIQHVEGAVLEYLHGPNPPYRFRVEDEYDTGDLVYRAVVDPREWTFTQLNDIALVTGDAIHNLRSALDFVAWQAVEANGGRPTRHTSFPIADSRQEFLGGGLKYLKGASDKALDILKQVRPYKGGNNALWRLHRLDIADKHRLLLGVGASYRSMHVTWRSRDGTEFRMPITPPAKTRTFPVVEETELYRVPFIYRDSAENHPHPQFAFEVAISDGDAVVGVPLVPTLRESLRAVERVIEMFLPVLDPARSR